MLEGQLIAYFMSRLIGKVASFVRKMSISEIPTVTRLSANLVRVLGCNPGPMTLQGTNTYVVGSGKRRVLIDTGDADKKPYIEALGKFLDSEQVEIDQIVITHWHHDHIDGVQDVQRLERAKNAVVWKFPRSDAKEEYDFPIKFLQDGQKIAVDGTEKDFLQIIHTPGHTTDHVVLTLASDNSLFSGDCILGEGTAVFEDLFDYMNSLEKILKLRPTVIYPGHGNVVQDPVAKIEYYIKHRQQREAQILDCLRTHPETAFTELGIVEKVYIGTPKELFPAAAYNVNHHLTKLRKENKVALEVAEDGANQWKYSGGDRGNMSNQL